jgi:hypothetical protein
VLFQQLQANLAVHTRKFDDEIAAQRRFQRRIDKVSLLPPSR